MNTKVTSLRLPTNMADELAAVARADDDPMSEVMRKALLVGPERIEGADLTDEFRGLVDDKLPGQLEKLSASPKSSHFENGSNLEVVVPPPGLEPGTFRCDGCSVHAELRGYCFA